MSCYLVSKLVEVMADETDNKNSAEKTNEISLKTPSDFCSPSYFQPQEFSQEHSM